jgi:hypothetical protein
VIRRENIGVGGHNVTLSSSGRPPGISTGRCPDGDDTR